MSSHHIVREAQEPALLIWDAESLESEHLAQLLEWSPTLIAKEDTLETILALGIKVDAVVCTPQKRKELEGMISLQSNIQLIPAASPEKRLEAVLRHLASQGQQAINVCATPSSAEKSILPALAEQAFLPNVVVLAGPEKWALYRNGRFTKWLPAQEAINVQGARPGLRFCSSGFASDMQDVPIAHRQLMQATEDGTKTITANGSFWIAELLS